MRFCIIDKNTKECINVVQLESAEEFATVNTNEELAPDHTGEIGWIWLGTEWQTTIPETSNEVRIEKVRLKRDRLLRLHIDTMNPMRWEAMSQVEKNNWIVYRQALLDVPQQDGYPDTIIWPTKP